MVLSSFKLNLSLEIIIPLGIIIILAITLFAFFIHSYFINSKHKKAIKSFTSGKNNLRLFTIDYKNESIYVVDKKNFKTRRRENFKWFYNSFSNEDSIRVKVWINELIKGDKKVKDNLEVQVSLGGKQKIFSVITCTGIDRENSIIHLESHLFQNIKNTKYNNGGKNSKIFNYHDLSSIYHSSRNEKFNVYLIRVFSSENSFNFKNIWTNKSLNTLLLSKVNRYLNTNMKICQTSQNELVILESNGSNKNTSIAYAHRFSSEVSKIINLNGLQNSYTYRIGIATGQVKLQTFDELVSFARKMTIEANNDYDDKIIYNSDYSNSEVKKQILEQINNIITNDLVDVEYTSMLNCTNGHLKGFFTNVIIKNDFFQSYLEMQEYAALHSQVKPIIEFLYKEINSIYINKYFLTTEQRRLFLKTNIKYVSDILSVVNSFSLPENVKTIFVFQEKDISKEAMNNSKNLLDSLIELKKENKLKLGIEFTSTALEMSDEILEMFDYFIFDQNNSFAQILTSTQDQILFQNLTNTLMDFPKGKLVAVNLKSWQAIEFFTSLGFKYVSGPYFGSEINKTPSIDTKKINKLLSLYD